MNAKLLLFIAVGVVAVWMSSHWFSKSSTEGSGCAAERVDALPACAAQARSGSNITIRNECDYTFTLMWDFFGAAGGVQELLPGEEKLIKSFPLKIESVACCAEYNRCF